MSLADDLSVTLSMLLDDENTQIEESKQPAKVFETVTKGNSESKKPRQLPLRHSSDNVSHRRAPSRHHSTRDLSVSNHSRKLPVLRDDEDRLSKTHTNKAHDSLSETMHSRPPPLRRSCSHRSRRIAPPRHMSSRDLSVSDHGASFSRRTGPHDCTLAPSASNNTLQSNRRVHDHDETSLSPAGRSSTRGKLSGSTPFIDHIIEPTRRAPVRTRSGERHRRLTSRQDSSKSLSSFEGQDIGKYEYKIMSGLVYEKDDIFQALSRSSSARHLRKSRRPRTLDATPLQPQASESKESKVDSPPRLPRRSFDRSERARRAAPMLHKVLKGSPGPRQLRGDSSTSSTEKTCDSTTSDERMLLSSSSSHSLRSVGSRFGNQSMASVLEGLDELDSHLLGGEYALHRLRHVGIVNGK